eukprot:6185933-Pleurochrysis_carterae.AAC.2
MFAELHRRLSRVRAAARADDLLVDAGAATQDARVRAENARSEQGALACAAATAACPRGTRLMRGLSRVELRSFC